MIIAKVFSLLFKNFSLDSMVRYLQYVKTLKEGL